MIKVLFGDELENYNKILTDGLDKFKIQLKEKQQKAILRYRNMMVMRQTEFEAKFKEEFKNELINLQIEINKKDKIISKQKNELARTYEDIDDLIKKMLK